VDQKLRTDTLRVTNGRIKLATKPQKVCHILNKTSLEKFLQRSSVFENPFEKKCSPVRAKIKSTQLPKLRWAMQLNYY